MVKHGLFSVIYIVFTVVDVQETSWDHLRSFAEEIPPPKERFFLPNVDFKYADAVETDVEFKYFKSVLTKQPKVLTIDTVKHVHMNKNVPTTYFIHGYTKDDSDPWYKPLRDELFMLRSHNVIYINWPNAANKSYAVSAANIKPIGYYIAKFIVASQVPLERVHLVGHSLGAHLAGFVGKWVISMTGDKVGRITGLDPAGPMFDYPTAPPTHRLDKSDAHFVDAVHTDIQGYGYTPPLGHVDFYPNGGKDQPGCPKEHVNGASNEVHEVTRAERFSYKNVDFKVADAVKTDIIYKYFKDASIQEPKVLTEETVSDEHMDKTVPTTYIIHGFTTDDTSPWFKPLKDALFKLGPHNVVYINWQKAGNKSYSVSSANVDPVGKYIAEFIIASGVPLGRVHLVGKWVQRLSGKNIGRITGLDPAGPRFDYPEAPPTNRLCSSDADFVDVIHTDIQHYGRKTKAKQAEYHEDQDYNVTIKVKDHPKEVTFGYHLDTSARGVYHFETNDDAPFLRLFNPVLPVAPLVTA
ncbi:unnamed protein product [Callosobruchus maculatus]|uniref:Lipase domain-containing protein n=1 Tax=Callosobruchus maculatus TaxID=64391 RepID=A0A653CS69_CALMS|nr:unnamed protein product [Callosobruchus maculatus]